MFNESNAVTSRQISLKKNDSRPIVNPSENIRIVVTRPEADEISKLKFEFIKDAERQADSRT